MNKENEPVRNRTSEEGEHNDPELRDESAPQPGVQTMSSSKTDEENNQLTQTAKDGFRTEDTSSGQPDRRYDDVDQNKD